MKKMNMTPEEQFFNQRYLQSLLIQIKHGNKTVADLKNECKKIVTSYAVRITKKAVSNVVHIENLPNFS